MSFLLKSPLRCRIAHPATKFSVLRGSQGALNRISGRNFCSKEENMPNLVQLMPSYQLALKLAMDKKYKKAIEKLELVLEELNTEHSPNTPYHIFTLYKMASINNIAGNWEENESVYERITEIAPMAYQDKHSLLYRCHNTLLKYYLTYDVDKCCKYGKDLTQSKFFEMDKLTPHEKFDLQHTLGTSFSLEGTSHDDSFKCYEESIRIAEEFNAQNDVPEAHISKGYALNNLGMGRFWYFIEKTKEIGETGGDDKKQMEAEMKQYVVDLELGIKNLKESVQDFENFNQRFTEGKMNQAEVKMKMFVDEFFDTEIKETLSKDFQQYDMRDNQMNLKFVSELFKQPQSCLPINNLGEISLIFNKMKEAMAFFDVALKIVSDKDPQNLISNKIISDLSGIIDLMGQTDMTIKMNKNVLKGLEHTNDYVKVFVNRNFGHILLRHKEHQDEGKRYIQKADDLDKNFPYWAERKLCLFTPVAPHEPLEEPL